MFVSLHSSPGQLPSQPKSAKTRQHENAQAGYTRKEELSQSGSRLQIAVLGLGVVVQDWEQTISRLVFGIHLGGEDMR
jgi:hypothetical protein